MKKAAIVYDFDKTLCGADMQEYSLIPALGYNDPKVFWDEVTELTKRKKMESISAYLFLLRKKFVESGQPLRKEDFTVHGQKIVLFPGVDSWFERINAYGRKAGFFIEHYIISSGMREIIEATPIADEFTKIYACRYYYDENGEAAWPALIVNYTTKTQFLFRINKGVLDEADDAGLNEYTPNSQRAIPFERMVYIADGLTDVPCLKLVKSHGGKSVAVYNPAAERSHDIASGLIKDGRANYMSPADYQKDSDMERLVMMIIDHMQADEALADREGRPQ